MSATQDFQSPIAITPINHTYQNVFDDDSYEVAQEETFTEDQLSMIKSSRNGTLEEGEYEEEEEEETEQFSLLNMDAYKPLVNQYGLITQFCNNHIANVQPIQAFCHECCQQLCIECILTNEHRGHHILSIHQAQNQCLKEFENQHDEILNPASQNLDQLSD